jgi:hypothetical protein
MTVAAIDRLVHHATILELNVESYRRRAAVSRHTDPADAASSDSDSLGDNPSDNTQEGGDDTTS